jgi:hypothetical protein
MRKPGRFPDAVQLLTRALAAEPDLHAVRAQLLCDRALAHLALAEWVRAADDCDEALRLHPTLVQARVRRGRACVVPPPSASTHPLLHRPQVSQARQVTRRRERL